MNLALAEKIAKAVLYEGYMLYPYRASSTNGQPGWTFGGVYPHAYNLVHSDIEPWTMQTECLVQGDSSTRLDLRLRFLHLQDRFIGELEPPPTDLLGGVEPTFRPVEALRVGSELYQTCQEAVERDVIMPDLTLGQLLVRSPRQSFRFPASREFSALRAPNGQLVGQLERSQQALEGGLELQAELLASGLFKLIIRVFNLTPLENAAGRSRNEALMRSFVSTHCLLSVQEGEFISLLNPPDNFKDFTAECHNVGTWPVLVGEEGEHDLLLLSPIILYDYPQIAPESATERFDGTEIDEILSSRVLTLTKAERVKTGQVRPAELDLA